MTNFARSLARPPARSRRVRAAFAVLAGSLLFSPAGLPRPRTVVDRSRQEPTVGAPAPQRRRPGEGSRSSFGNTRRQRRRARSAASTRSTGTPSDLFHHEWVAKIDDFFQQMGAASGGTRDDLLHALASTATVATARRATRHVFKGAYSDTAKYPRRGCTDPNPLDCRRRSRASPTRQLREQLQIVHRRHGLPTGMDAVYYLLTPPGVTVCLDAAATHCSDYALPEAELEKANAKARATKQLLQLPRRHQPRQRRPRATATRSSTPRSPGPPGTSGHSGDFTPGRAAATTRPTTARTAAGTRKTNEEKSERAAERSSKKKRTKKLEERRPPKKKKNRNCAPPRRARTSRSPTRKAKAKSATTPPVCPTCSSTRSPRSRRTSSPTRCSTRWQDATRQRGHRRVPQLLRHDRATGQLGGSRRGGPQNGSGHPLTTRSSANGQLLHQQRLQRGSADAAASAASASSPRFTAPNPVNAGEIVGFDGMESDGRADRRRLASAPSGPPTHHLRDLHLELRRRHARSERLRPRRADLRSAVAEPVRRRASSTPTRYGGTYT